MRLAPWTANPFGLVSLMELLEFCAGEYWRLAGLLGQLIVQLDTFKTGKALPGPQFYQNFGGSLGNVAREVKSLGLPMAQKQIDHLKAYLDDNPSQTTFDGLYNLVTGIHSRVMDELDEKAFLMLPSDRKRLYSQPEPLFGTDVEKKFPSMSEDIAEAGKCLALNRSTASVFHLMRVMELGVQHLGDALGVKLVQEKNWQPILDETNKAIRLLDHKQPRTKALAEAANHLYNAKVAWRNEVMHPKQTYTPEEAEKIFSCTKTFIADLVTLV
jgi:hypothetical protein